MYREASEIRDGSHVLGLATEPIPMIRVMTYKSERDYQRDASLLLRDGWRLEAQSTRTKNFGLTGFYTNKGLITVTWVKLPAEAPPSRETGSAAMRPAALATAP